MIVMELNKNESCLDFWGGLDRLQKAIEMKLCDREKTTVKICASF